MPYVFYSDNDGVAHYLNKQLNIVTYPFPTYYTLPSENNRDYPKNQFMMDYEGRWYYFNKDGFPITGPKTIDGFELYFHESSRPEGHQAKGEFINIDNKIYYFDKDNGRKVKDTSFELNGIHYIADKEGTSLSKVILDSITNMSAMIKATGITTTPMAINSLANKTLITSKFTLRTVESKLKDTSLRMDTSMTRIVVNLLPMLM